MKPHPEGGWTDANGDRYVWVGKELRKISSDGRTFAPRREHSLEAQEFQDAPHAPWTDEMIARHFGQSKTKQEIEKIVGRKIDWVAVERRMMEG